MIMTAANVMLCAERMAIYLFAKTIGFPEHNNMTAG